MVDRAVTNDELESVILEDPLDPAGWLVYGDHLQAEGDPRGELVAVQARLARDPGNPELMAAQRALFAKHGAALLEGLDRFLAPNPLFRLSWEFGFIWTANVSANGHTLDQFCEGLAALLAHPSARFLHALTIGTPPDNGWPRVLAILAGLGADRAAASRPLRILFLGDGALSAGHPRPAFGPIGDLGHVWGAVPYLEVLGLCGGVMNVGNLELPRLRELTIETSALQRETLFALGARAWPSLERLELWFGDRRCTCTVADLAPLFQATMFPALARVGLRNCSFVDRICHALAHAPIGPQLRVLDLSLGALTDMGAAALVDAKENLPNLAVLDLRWNYFHAEWWSPLSHLARFVDMTERGFASDREDRRRPKVWLDT